MSGRLSRALTGGDSGDGWLSGLLTRRLLQYAATAVGAVSLVAALVVATGIDGGRVLALVPVPDRAVVAGAAGVGAVVSFLALREGTNDGADVSLPSPPDEDATGRDVVGQDFEERVELFAHVDDYDSLWERYDVESRLRGLAVELLAEHAGYDRESAETAVELGTWTDDPRAATFLGSDVPLPFTLRAVDWAMGQQRTRQARATVQELADLAGVEADVAGDDVVPAELEAVWARDRNDAAEREREVEVR